MSRSLAFSAIAASLLLAGCGPEKEPEAMPPRPVLSIVANNAIERQSSFTGTVEPRYQTDRGFQVLGRIIARYVDVGDTVVAGQKLAENEPLTYQLAVQSSEAELTRAKSELVRAEAARQRMATLVAGKIEPQAALDSADQALDSASAAVRQAEANLVKARENLRYTTLTADAPGVVTSVYADVGQVASPGMRVMTIARTDVREAVVDLPEDVVRSLRPGSRFQIALQADPTITSGGTVREIAPQADAATRTRRVRITLDRSADPFRLGAVIAATPVGPEATGNLEVPETAILDRDGKNSVWIVDTASKTVRNVPVEIAGRHGGLVHIASGITPGAHVVTAGVHLLKEGEAIAWNQGNGQ